MDGTIPTSIFSTILLFLDLYENRFSGTIPPEIGNADLRYLHFGENELEGTIPVEFAQGNPNLIFLDLSENQLSGTLPDNFGNWNDLAHLELAANSFVGTVPDSLFALRDIELFDISYNYFEGTLPLEYADYEDLRLNSNLFIGGLPEWVCELERFDARINFFYCDDLPECCGYEGKRNCIPCYDEGVNPFTPFPPPTPTSVVPTPAPAPSQNSAVGVESAEWIQKDMFFLGTQRKIFEYDFSFTDDLYMLETVGCESEICSEVNSTIDSNITCDYSSLESNGCDEDYFSCSQASTLCYSTEDGSSSNFTTLERGVVMKVERQQANVFKQFRYFSNISCTAVSIRVFAISGDPDLYVSQETEPNIRDYEKREERSGGDEVIFCPPGAEGNYFIGVYAYRGLAAYEIIVDEVEFYFPPNPPPPPRQERQDVGEAETEIELSNGRIHEEKDLSLTTALELYWEPDWEELAGEDNPNCTIHFEANGDVRMVIEVEYNYTKSDKEEESYNSGARYEGRSWIALSFCNEMNSYIDAGIENADPERWLPRKFELEVTGDGDATILVTTLALVRRRGLVDYPSADLISQISRRQTTNGLTFEYDEDCPEDCNDIIIWNGVTGNAFYPPLTAASLANQFVIFEDDLPPQSKKLFTYLDVPVQKPRFYGKDGTTYGSYEEFADELATVAKSMFVIFGRTFVNKDGELSVYPPQFEFRSSPQKVTCDPDAFHELAEDLTKFLQNNFPTESLGDPEEVGDLISDLIRIDAQRYTTTWSACERQMYEFFDMGPYNWTRNMTYDQICLLTNDASACQNEECGNTFEGDFETELLEGVRDNVVEESCLDPECANLFLNDFGEDQNFLRARLCSAEGTLDADNIQIDSLWYRNCKKTYLGFDKKGRECLADIDCYIEPNCTNGICTGLGRNCINDDDCIYESECNFFSRLCTDDPQTISEMFLKCFVDNMPLAQQQSLAQELRFSLDPTSREFFDTLKDYFGTEDCIGMQGSGLNTSIPFRRHYDLNVLTSSFTDLYGCRCSEETGELTPCLDSLCLAPDACEFKVYESLVNLLSEQEQTNKAIGCTVYSAEDSGNPNSCLQHLACNWIDESAFTYQNESSSSPSPSPNPPSTFEDICLNPQSWTGGPTRDQTHFCSICVGDRFPCVEIFGLETEEKCEQASVCLTPEGGYLLKTNGEEWDDDDCQKQSGQCAGFCEVDPDDDDDDGTDFDDDDVDCISRRDGAWSVCYYDKKVSEEECVSYGGQFQEIEGDDDDDDEMMGECIFPHLTEEDECEDVGLKYYSCNKLSNDQCANYQDHYPTENDYLSCFLSEYKRCERNQCEPPFGVCSDRFLINLNTPNDLAPVESCVIPFAKGENSYFCPVGSFVTQLGCVYQNYPFYNAETCQLVGGKMVSASETREACEAQGQGCESAQTTETGLLTDLKEEECVSCGGTWQNYFTWRDAEWIVGKVKKPQWIQRQSIPINEIGDTLNFIEMADSVAKPALDDFVYSLEGEGLCTSSLRVINAINVIACGCNGFEYSGTFTNPIGRTEIVFTDTDSQDIASDIGTDYDEECEQVTDATLPIRKNVCPSQTQSLVSTSTFMIWQNAFKDGIYVCLAVSAEYLAADDYTEPIANPISVSFLRRQEQESVYAVVRNSNDVVIGQLIGDGVQVNVSSDIQDWEEFLPLNLDQICFAIRDDITVLSDYNTYDVGKLNPETGIITPIDAKQADSTILALTEFVCFENLTLYEYSNYFPIAREKDYEDERVLNTAERAIVFTTAALYTLGILILVFFFTGVPLHSITGPMKTNYIIGVQCFILYVFRAVYFYLLGTYVVPGDSEDVTDYILIEIPTFLYLGMFILIVLSFLFVYLRGYRDMMLSDNAFWGSFAVCQIIIWLSFVAVVVALATLDEGGEEIRTCSGRLTDETVSEKDDARVIRIAYKSAIVVISLVVVIMMAILTVTIQQKGTVFLQVLFASFGLLLNSVAFIVYYAIDEPSTYFAIVLWVTELVPTLVMCLIVSPRRYFRSEVKSRQRDKSSSKSPDSISHQSRR